PPLRALRASTSHPSILRNTDLGVFGNKRRVKQPLIPKRQQQSTSKSYQKSKYTLKKNQKSRFLFQSDDTRTNIKRFDLSVYAINSGYGQNATYSFYLFN